MNAFQTVLSEIFDRGVERRFDDVDAEREAIELAKEGDETATVALLYAYASALRNGVRWFANAAPSAPQAADLEDVRVRAVLGLQEAIRAFDPARHRRLAAIAAGYIADEVASAAEAATAFSVPERTLKRFFGILRKADGNVYEAAALAPQHEMKRETFFAVLSAVRDVTSYDAALGGNSGGFDGTTGERFAEGVERGIVARPIWSGEHADAEDRVLVEAAFGAVDELEARVCRLAYGFEEYDPLPDAEIGHRLGMSRPKTQRVRAGALGKMREALGVA